MELSTSALRSEGSREAHVRTRVFNVAEVPEADRIRLHRGGWRKARALRLRVARRLLQSKADGGHAEQLFGGFLWPIVRHVATPRLAGQKG
jgi:hypothetical protein